MDTSTRQYSRSDQGLDDARSEIKDQIAGLEREDWHSDDRSRRSMIQGLKVAQRIVEKHQR